jgi:hypothetical protein
MQLNMNGMRLSPLPKRKTAVHVFGDFLTYLYRCTRIFITDTHANGAALWNAVENDIQFVLSHPNGWEGAQQTKMRRAAVYGALIPDTNEGKARIRFVTEGEASLHACVLNGLAADVLSVCLFSSFFSLLLCVNMGDVEPIETRIPNRRCRRGYPGHQRIRHSRHSATCNGGNRTPRLYCPLPPFFPLLSA